MKDAPLPDPLADRLGYLLKQAHARLAAGMAEALAPYRLHPRELGVMAAIEAGGRQSSQMEIAERIGLDRTSMVGVVDALEEKGYVERRRSDRDRRRNVVTLTPVGERTLAEAERARERVDRDFLAPLDPAAAAALVETLAALHRAHGRDVAGPPECPVPHGRA
ncbi:MarR family winged helix-turn-helix transcriptional regulator [Streptomyces sp. MJP52]|uniref:MarR family winged helix-turn-helix transcriptional regulator n=1 Tax=Streptomyces sp. MJP52 TaxID=2940555 RepID=UPI00247676AF|nr:MarR family winged helix-turn-helix transcriptional regulator [Streptomyces sp. MJP52]MDH6225551.1 DNA-binding MarR family transcriptional regulator [Streptomyces sp. MJP52]